MILTPKNWNEFQHYRNRRPPWIKLHRGLLENYEFVSLPIEARAIAPMLWLIASEYDDGAISMSPNALAFRLRIDMVTLERSLKSLVEYGFFSAYGEDASVMLAGSSHSASAEREGETEGEREPTQEKSNVGTRTWGVVA